MDPAVYGDSFPRGGGYGYGAPTTPAYGAPSVAPTPGGYGPQATQPAFPQPQQQPGPNQYQNPQGPVGYPAAAQVAGPAPTYQQPTGGFQAPPPAFPQAGQASFPGQYPAPQAQFTMPQPALNQFLLSGPVGPHNKHARDDGGVGPDNKRARTIDSSGGGDRERFAPRNPQPPSKVLHVRNLPPGTTDHDLQTLASPFGRVLKSLVLSNKNQAFIELETVAVATQMVDYYASQPPSIQSKTVLFQYSNRQSIVVDTRSSAPPNKILLLTIQNMKVPVTIENLEQVFAHHGSVLKIAIFMKNGFHALIEMGSVTQTNNALEKLNGQDMFVNCNTMRLQYSKLEKLNVQYNNEKSRDFTDSTLPTVAANSPAGGGGLYPPAAFPGPPSFMPPDMGQFPFAPAPGGFQQQNQYGGGGDAARITLEAGGVLLVNNLDEEKASCDRLFTLFGVYGDVYRVKILYNKKSSALVQLANQQQANTAMLHLNRQTLWGKDLSISPSRYHEVQMPRPQEGMAEDPLTKDYADTRDHRFQFVSSKNFRNICAPTNVIHLSNLHVDCTEDELRQHFGQTYDVQGVQFFKNDRRMALVELSNPDIGLQCLMTYHNTELGGKKIKIGFSRKTLSQQQDNNEQPQD